MGGETNAWIEFLRNPLLITPPLLKNGDYAVHRAQGQLGAYAKNVFPLPGAVFVTRARGSSACAVIYRQDSGAL
jgi:hypothetical protein